MKIQRKYAPDSADGGFTLADLSDLVEDALRAGVPSSSPVDLQYRGPFGAMMAATPAFIVVEEPMTVRVDPMHLQIKLDEQPSAPKREDGTDSGTVDRPDDWGV